MSQQKTVGGHTQRVAEPKDDIAARIQALVWVAGVLARSKKTREKLQSKYVTYERGVDASKTFIRIEQVGHDPNSKKTIIGENCPQDVLGLTLAQRVAKTRKLRQTLITHKSELWDLVTPPKKSPEILSEVISKLLRELGLTRDPFHRAARAKGRRTQDVVSISDQRVSEQYQQGLKYVASIGSANSLALLTALHIEALDHGAYSHLVPIRTAITVGMNEFFLENHLFGIAPRLVFALIDRRILRSHWGKLTTPAEREAAEAFIRLKMTTHSSVARLKPSQIGKAISLFALEKAVLLRPQPTYFPALAPIKVLSDESTRTQVLGANPVELNEEERMRKLVEEEGPWIVSADHEITETLISHIFLSDVRDHWNPHHRIDRDLKSKRY
jgi:hypothetical protein